jgi:hypothetical protein
MYQGLACLAILKENYHCYVSRYVGTVGSVFLKGKTCRKTTEMTALTCTQMLQVASQVQGLVIPASRSFRTSVLPRLDVTE